MVQIPSANTSAPIIGRILVDGGSGIPTAHGLVPQTPLAPVMGKRQLSLNLTELPRAMPQPIVELWRRSTGWVLRC